MLLLPLLRLLSFIGSVLALPENDPPEYESDPKLFRVRGGAFRPELLPFATTAPPLGEVAELWFISAPPPGEGAFILRELDLPDVPDLLLVPVRDDLVREDRVLVDGLICLSTGVPPAPPVDDLVLDDCDLGDTRLD